MVCLGFHKYYVKEAVLLTTVIGFLILLGVLITIHEFGHFLFAKLFKVKVEVFSIGFGPPLIKWKGKETVYQIALIPLGGYVKMYGEDSMTEPVQGKVDKSVFNDPRSFHSKPKWQKILIAFAGPLFNIIFAIFAFTTAYMIGISKPTYLDKPVVVGYVEKDSLGEKLGLQVGDKIVAIDGEPVRNWQDLTIKLGMRLDKEVNITVLRDGKEVNIKTKLPDDLKKLNLGIAPLIEPIVGAVEPNSPANKVGIKAGDIILAINNKPVKSWYDILNFMKNYREGKVSLLIKRNNKIIKIEIKPEFDKKVNRYVIGIAPKTEMKVIKLGFVDAIKKAFEKSYELTVSLGEVIKGLITGEVSFKTLGGPIAIAKFSGQALESGISTFLFSMGFISLQLGYLNLLPIPVLDGGLIAILLIEMIIRRDLPEKVKEYIAYLGFALIGLLMFFVIMNDILRLISH